MDRFKKCFLNKRGLISVAVFTIIFVVTSFIVALPQYNKAHAAGASLSVTPASAGYLPGEKITVLGSNYASSESVQIYWRYVNPTNKGTLETTAISNASGAFSTSFVVPLAPTATYTIAGIGQQSGLVATGTFQLLPRFYLTSNAGGTKTTIFMHGNSYGAGETVNIYWNYTGPGTGTLLMTAIADATGTFAISAPAPASSTYGHIPIAGTGSTSNMTASTYFVLYPPTLALAPLSGSVGTQVTISAYGFKSSEVVNVYWNNGATAVITATTNKYGYLAPTTYTVPAGATPGTYPVKIVGSATHLAITNTYTVVAPGSTLSITSVPAGVGVNLSGQGYALGETVNIYWGYSGPGTGTNVGSGVVGLSGAFNAAFNVPVANTGSYTIAAVGASSNDVSTTTLNVVDGLAASPSTTSPGTSVVAAGTGFQANEQVKVYWNTASGASLGTATADANGNITMTVQTPPTAASGSNRLVGVGQSSGTAFMAPVTINTNWANFGFDLANHRQNLYENSLSPTNVAQLKLKWTANVAPQANSLYTGFPSQVYANGLVYIASDYGVLYAYHATTGVLAWKYDMGVGFANLSSPVVDPTLNLVFFATIGDDFTGIPSPLYALNATSGQLVWSEILSGGSYAFPRLAFNTMYIGVSEHENNPGVLNAIDEMTGHIQWQYHTGGGVWGSVAMDTSSNMVFTSIGNATPSVAALNATTGAQIWLEPIPVYGKDDDVGSAITVDNGFVYASSKDGSMFALVESTGVIAWSTPIGNHSNADESSQTVSNGIVYVASLSGYFYALNATTGSVLWKVFLSSGMFSSPVLANGVIYVAGKNFYAINASNGATLWSYAIGVVVYSTPVVVNGWLYCASYNGNLYAFSL